VAEPGGIDRKTTDRRLLEILRAGGEAPVPVLVEVVGPRPRVEFGPSDTGGSPRPRSVSPAEAPTGELPEEARRIESVLYGITGEPPVWLAAARSFSVLATPQQIEAIAAASDVSAIFLNRRVAGP
jgi:hypothetical protein